MPEGVDDRQPADLAIVLQILRQEVPALQFDRRGQQDTIPPGIAGFEMQEPRGSYCFDGQNACAEMFVSVDDRKDLFRWGISTLEQNIGDFVHYLKIGYALSRSKQMAQPIAGPFDL